MKKKLWLPTIVLLILLASMLFLGSAPPSPLYYLKISRETIQTFFIFGDEDKTNWLLTRADKRISEALKLKSRHLDFLADLQISIAIDYQTQAKLLLENLKDKTNINYLTDKYNQNNDKLNALKSF